MRFWEFQQPGYCGGLQGRGLAWPSAPGGKCPPRTSLSLQETAFAPGGSVPPHPPHRANSGLNTQKMCVLRGFLTGPKNHVRTKCRKAVYRLTLRGRPLEVDLYTAFPHFRPNRAKAVAKVYKTCIQVDLYTGRPIGLSLRGLPLEVDP